MESTTINKAIKEVRELFNKVRDNLSREEINRIWEKLYKNEADYNSLKGKDQKMKKNEENTYQYSLIPFFFFNKWRKKGIKEYCYVS